MANDDLTIYAYSGPVDSGFPRGTLAYLDSHELAKPERLALLRSFGIPEAPISDYEIIKTGEAEHCVSFNRQGNRRRVPQGLGSDPAGSGASDVVAFTVDGNNRVHYLRRRGVQAPSQSIAGQVVSRRIA